LNFAGKDFKLRLDFFFIRLWEKSQFNCL